MSLLFWKLARAAWALIVPPLLVAGIVAGIAVGSPPLFWLIVMGCVAAGAIPLAFAEWHPATRAALTILYVLVMGGVVLVTAILSACYAHGCH